MVQAREVELLDKNPAQSVASLRERVGELRRRIGAGRLKLRVAEGVARLDDLGPRVVVFLVVLVIKLVNVAGVDALEQFRVEPVVHAPVHLLVEDLRGRDLPDLCGDWPKLLEAPDFVVF